MENIFNVHDAKTRFSKILAKVQAGEDVIIAKNGRPVAKLIPFERKVRGKRPFGTARGKIRLLPGWEAPLSGKALKEFDS